MNELISLIVPIYNGEKWIDNFLNQFEEQTYRNIELIAVDDGSTDHTPELLDRYAEKKGNVVVCHKKNDGPSSARNVGLERATGNYIAFADVDDRFYPTYLEYLYKLIKKEDADMSVCSYIKMNENENWDKYLNKINTKFHVINDGQIMDNFAYRKNINGYCYLKLIKADIAKHVRFPEDIVYGEDYIYVYKIVKKCKKVIYGEQIQYIYIQYNDSSTHQERDNTLKYKKAWKKHLEVLEDVRKNYPDNYLGILEKCYLLAINNVTRIFDKKRDKEFLQELECFIKINASTVYKNKQSGKKVRVLGLLGIISVRLLVLLCNSLFWFQCRSGLTFRKTQ